MEKKLKFVREHLQFHSAVGIYYGWLTAHHYRLRGKSSHGYWQLHKTFYSKFFEDLRTHLPEKKPFHIFRFFVRQYFKISKNGHANEIVQSVEWVHGFVNLLTCEPHARLL